MKTKGGLQCMNDQPLVKHQNKYWVLDRVLDDKAELWRDGKRIIVSVESLEINKKTGGYKIYE
jgi:hypothetical protein